VRIGERHRTAGGDQPRERESRTMSHIRAFPLNVTSGLNRCHCVPQARHLVNASAVGGDRFDCGEAALHSRDAAQVVRRASATRADEQA